MLNDDVTIKTKVIFASEARKKLYEGLNIVAEAVGCTLGPKGKTVLIQNNDSAPVVTKDGITVSKSIRLKNTPNRMGAELIREAAAQTNETAGDGTTTATVLTHAMVKEGLKLIDAGYSSTEVCKGIEFATQKIIEKLKLAAKQLSTTNEVTQIATISSNGDQKIGEIIAKAMDKVGRDGIITVEDAKGMITNLDVVEGMQFDRGYLSPYFVTNQDKMNVVYNNVRVLITDRKIAAMRDLVPLLEKIVQTQSSLLIIAEDVEGEALQGLVLNKVKSNLKVVAIKSPGYGAHREELLRDICILTGAKLISASGGFKLETISLDDLGLLKKIVIDAKTSTLVGSSNTIEIEKHVAGLRSQLDDVTNSSETITKLKMRIAKLASGVAVIKVGGVTEVEMIERKYRIEDALNATRAAAEEGVVAGGGMALLRASTNFLYDKNDKTTDFTKGVEVVLKACLAPITKIITNAGKSPDVIINDLLKDETLGYNAANDEYVNMLLTGVIDPVKVTRTALQNASSVTMTFLSLDAIIIEEENE